MAERKCPASNWLQEAACENSEASISLQLVLHEWFVQGRETFERPPGLRPYSES